jgi:hypothetical protein
MFQLNNDNMLHFNEMMMMMRMMVSACTRPTCLVTDLNGARLLQQQSVGTHVASLISGYTCRLTHQWVHMSPHSSVGTHVASLISGYTCRFTHIMMIPDQPVAI